MNCSIYWHNTFRYMNEVSELILDYDEVEPKLVEMVSKSPENQRIVLNISKLSEENFKNSLLIFEKSLEVHKNIRFMLSKGDRYFIDVIKNTLKAEYFFIEFPRTIDEINGLINLGASDIYITNELGFLFNILQPYLLNKNVTMRLIPNVAQASDRNAGSPNICKFFIRPEDMPFYKKENVIFEFYGPQDRQSVLYEIYSKEKWDGDLSAVILELNESIPNNSINPTFGLSRTRCEKKCAYGKCDICPIIQDTASMLAQERIVFEKVKNDN